MNNKLMTIAAIGIAFAGLGTTDTVLAQAPGTPRMGIAQTAPARGMRQGAGRSMQRGAMPGARGQIAPRQGLQNGPKNGLRNGLPQGPKLGLRNGLQQGPKNGPKNGLRQGPQAQRGPQQAPRQGFQRGPQQGGRGGAGPAARGRGRR